MELRNSVKFKLLAGALCAIAAVNAAPPAPKASLRAAAARIDITPDKDEALQMSGYAARKVGHKGIHDNLYVRAIVLDNGAARAAIVTADLIGFSHQFCNNIAERIASETKIPRDNLLIAATHTHSAPSPGVYGRQLDPESKQAKYVTRVGDSMVAAVKQCLTNLQAAKIGAGTGRANLNVNRRAIGADGKLWLGVNPDGPSDKAVAVVKVESAAGEPIAIFSNYASHGTGMGQDNYLISADIPGATARYVEQHYGDKIVAPWTSGAAGDQCPIYDRSSSSFSGVMAFGRVLGEEVIRVADKIQTSSQVSIRGAQKMVSCPGQKFVDGPHGRRDGHFEDGPPVDIRLSLLKVNDIALGGVSGEVLTMIGQRYKREAKAPNTVMITNCNGSSGYLADDKAYENVSYEIQTTKVKAGCAETSIVNGLLELINGRPPVAAKKR